MLISNVDYLLRRLGEVETLTRVQAKTYDPETSQVALTKEKWPVTAVVVTHRIDRANKKTLLSEKAVLIAAKDLQSIPQLQDEITLYDTVHYIVSITPMHRQGRVLGYLCNARAGAVDRSGETA